MAFDKDISIPINLCDTLAEIDELEEEVLTIWCVYYLISDVHPITMFVIFVNADEEVG